MRVLAVGAHPDDLEILCGGTLAKYASQGAEVFMAHLCDGSRGHMIIPPDELVKIRDGEARKSAALIGAKSLTLDVIDLDAYVEREVVVNMVEVIRATRPDVIITHAPNDYMPDHTVTGTIVFNASFIATLPHTKTKSPHYEKLTPVYYMDTVAGVDSIPTEYVDITDFLETKLKMMSQHDSQIQWLKHHDNADMLDFIETVAKFRGLQCGCKYAEGFTHANRWGRNQTKRVLP